jgi:hypothetical protein
MKIQEHPVNKGSVIRTYDNLFPLKLRDRIYAYAIRSSFQIGWADGTIIENSMYKYLHARFSPEEVNRLGIMFHLAPTPVFRELAGYRLSKTVLNLSTPSDVHFAHAHPEAKVLLYYVNMEWRSNWYGETLFYDESLENIVLALPYTPGRVVVFDGAIPHSIRPQSHVGPFYRFTLAMFFEKE